MTTTDRSVHPRVCGEQLASGYTVNRWSGSSPRVRGTDDWRELTVGNLRFIPACAGNSRQGLSRSHQHAVHPRVCGEQAIRFHASCAYCRFIPACAGNRTRSRPVSRKRNGSSPRVRGTARGAKSDFTLARFIPACAGNRCADRRRHPPASVHPRVCGEQTHGPRPERLLSGSSPRVRGTDQIPRSDIPQRRFIPACAGNRRFHAPPRCRSPVHPRVCGEQGTTPIDVAPVFGSSPRVRGTGRFERHDGC